MRRVIQRDLMRGHVANRAAILLLFALLTVLALSFLSGVRHLSS
jgi:hypothetical protein